MKLRWTEPALRDLESIGDRIAKADPAAAARIADRIFVRVDQLVAFRIWAGLAGSMGHVSSSSRRRRFSCYRLRGETIELLAVLHGTQQWPETFD